MLIPVLIDMFELTHSLTIRTVLRVLYTWLASEDKAGPTKWPGLDDAICTLEKKKKKKKHKRAETEEPVSAISTAARYLHEQFLRKVAIESEKDQRKKIAALGSFNSYL